RSAVARARWRGVPSRAARHGSVGAAGSGDAGDAGVGGARQDGGVTKRIGARPPSAASTIRRARPLGMYGSLVRGPARGRGGRGTAAPGTAPPTLVEGLFGRRLQPTRA